MNYFTYTLSVLHLSYLLIRDETATQQIPTLIHNAKENTFHRKIPSHISVAVVKRVKNHFTTTCQYGTGINVSLLSETICQLRLVIVNY